MASSVKADSDPDFFELSISELVTPSMLPASGCFSAGVCVDGPPCAVRPDSRIMSVKSQDLLVADNITFLLLACWSCSS